MASGIYTAMNGARAQERTLETISSNLANARTPGFKREETVYRAIEAGVLGVGSPTQAGGLIRAPTRWLPRDRIGVVVEERFTEWTRGGLQATDNSLDLALEGDGFFVVRTQQGDRYTRNGTFTLNGDRMLVTQTGLPVLGTDGEPIELADAIEPPTITPTGEVLEGGDEVGRIAVVRFPDPQVLEPEAAGLFAAPPPQPPNPPLVPAAVEEPIIRQGWLEGSNVNPITSLSLLIKTHRLFELNTKAIKAYRQMDEQATRDVGRVA